MVENKKIKLIKKVITDLNAFLNIKLKDNETKKFYYDAEADLENFIETGTDKFYRREIIFGDEELVEIHIKQSLANVSVLEISKTIVMFYTKPSSHNFIKLCNAYFFDLLTYISMSKDNPISFFESDISLLYIFTMTFFPEKVDKIEQAILKGLEYRKSVRDNNIRKMEGSYGRDSTLYLAYWLAREYQRNEKVVQEILNYCEEKIDSVYLSALKNIFSKSEDIVAKCVNEMAEYHISKSKTSDLTYPFHINHWIYFPVEILSLLKIRESRCQDNNFISHPLFNVFLPFYLSKVPLDDYTEKLSKRVFSL